MADILYTAVTGLQDLLHQQTLHNHNLANQNTTGFRADLNQAQSLLLQGSGLPLSVYSQIQASGSDFSVGTRVHTGHDLDIAVDDKAGWIAVQNAEGQEAYTRAGHLKIDANGQLRTDSGFAVLGNGGPISIPPAEKITLAKDGTVTLRPLGQPVTALVVLDRIKLVSPDQTTLGKGLDGLFYLKQGGVSEANARVKITAGVIEGSNVSMIEELVQLMEISRSIEVQMKLIHGHQKSGQQLANLLS